MSIQNKNNYIGVISIIGVVAIVVFGVASIAFIGANLSLIGDSGAVGPEVEMQLPPSSAPSATALEAIHVRSGPGTLYPSFGVASRGTTGEVIGKSANGQWWVVRLPITFAAVGQGWVSAQFVEVTNADNVPVIPAPPLPPTIEVQPPPAGAPNATAIQAVHVRSGPGTQFPAFGIAPRGTRGEVIGVSQNGRWWVVRLPTHLVGMGQGWVSADWVTTQNTSGVPVIPPPSDEPRVQPTPPPAGVPTATALDFIHVRTGPGTQFASFGIARPGASAEIIGQSADGNWWAIRLETVSAGQAWVSASFVRAENAGSIPVMPAP
jgi:uncharacterized protein YraI